MDVPYRTVDNSSNLEREHHHDHDHRDPARVKRLFLYEPGWKVGLKVGSERVFCYMKSPGQDYYHRLLDGELYLYSAEETICMACGARRGLLSSEPRTLREPVDAEDLPVHTQLFADGPGATFELAALEGGPPEDDDYDW